MAICASFIILQRLSYADCISSRWWAGQAGSHMRVEGGLNENGKPELAQISDFRPGKPRKAFAICCNAWTVTDAVSLLSIEANWASVCNCPLISLVSVAPSASLGGGCPGSTVDSWINGCVLDPILRSPSARRFGSSVKS